jgi:hypothetical protein
VVVSSHQDPVVVVVLALLEELLTEPVLPKPGELDELDDPELEDPELEDTELEDPELDAAVSEDPVELDVPEELDVVSDSLDVEAATVPSWLDAYASARWIPTPPAASVVARRTPAVQRRVVDSARLMRRLVMPCTIPGGPSPIL